MKKDRFSNVTAKKSNETENFVTIRQEGGSRVISITKLLPNDWKLINCSIVKENEKEVIIKFVKVV